MQTYTKIREYGTYIDKTRKLFKTQIDFNFNTLPHYHTNNVHINSQFQTLAMHYGISAFIVNSTHVNVQNVNVVNR